MKWLISVSSLLLSLCVYSQEITIGKISNKIVHGDLIGNRNLEFGIKSILEELVQDQGYDLVENSELILEVDLLYFDVKRTSANAAVFTKTNNQVEIIAEGRFNGKKVKVKATADNIITSTIILNNQGTFNQQSVSTALKRLCNQIIDKLKL